MTMKIANISEIAEINPRLPAVRAATDTELLNDRRSAGTGHVYQGLHRWIPGGRVLYLVLVAALLIIGAGSGAATAQQRAEGIRPGKRATGQQYMVAAAHPLAAEAGVRVLEQGGNAMDAAAAAAFALGVVEPMMTGMGGGGGIAIWDSASKRADYLCAYPSAGANPDFGSDTPERRSALPGAVAGLYEAHKAYGSLEWEKLLQPAIELAEEGFHVYPALSRIIASSKSKLHHSPEAAALFYPDGEPLQAGDVLRRPEKAAVLRRVASEGRDGFYTGEVAERIVQVLSEGGGALTLEDFASFEPKWYRPLAGGYGPYTVFSAAPPLSGLEVAQALALMEAAGIEQHGLPTEDPAALGVLIDALRISRTDRGAYLGDPRDGNVPACALLHPDYIAQRVEQMGGEAPDRLQPGDPQPFMGATPPVRQGREVFTGGERFDGPLPELPEEEEGDDAQQTTHLSVVDKDGNAVSLTYTVGLYFGSGAYADGIFFNTVGGNFSRQPASNRIGPYRTPRSSMAPTIVVEDDQLRLVVGSPASGRIPPAITSMILYTLTYGLDPWEAIHMPRVYPWIASTTVQIESGFPGEVLAPIRQRGYRLEVLPAYDMYFGGVHMIFVREDGALVGAADPRRDGAAIGK